VEALHKSAHSGRCACRSSPGSCFSSVCQHNCAIQSMHRMQQQLVRGATGRVPLLPTPSQPLVQRPCTRCSAAAPETSTSGPSYPYNGGDVRQKATIEHVFQPVVGDSASTSTSSSEQTPWAVGWQMNERNLVWSDDLKLRLIKVTVTRGRCADTCSSLEPSSCHRLSAVSNTAAA
jgi:hypothetical protein